MTQATGIRAQNPESRRNGCVCVGGGGGLYSNTEDFSRYAHYEANSELVVQIYLTCIP